MSIVAVWREYNPSTGVLLGTVANFDFGNVTIGEFSPVRVFDIVVPEASQIANVQLEITASPYIEVNPGPVDVGPDGSSANGNFGIETSDKFISKNTLVRFFAGLYLPVTVGTRGGNVSKFIYLNSKMLTDSTIAGTATYKVLFDYS